MATTKAATNREIKVLNRYSIKQDCPEKGLHKGDVVLHVRNDKGVEYYTTLRRNKAHSCSCVATRRCYHINRGVELENARYDAAKVVVLPTPVEAPKEVPDIMNAPLTT